MKEPSRPGVQCWMLMKRVLMLLSISVLALASCGGKSHSKTEHNAADIEFARQTIAGHQVSIETVKLALPRINTPDVKKLAKEIETAEEEVLKSMEKLLVEWGVHEKIHDELPEDERHELEHAEGTELDRVFLRLMIDHHHKAVNTTKAVLKGGQSKEAEKLAHEMLRAQERELEEMEKVLVGV